MITISNSASNAQYVNYLNTYKKEYNNSLNRLATGYKLDSAADDAGRYQTAVDATRELRGIEIANQNALTGRDICAVADESLTKITEYANTIQSLAIKALNGTDDERIALQDQANALINDMKNIKNNTEYNKTQVFRAEGFILQVGYEGDENSSFKINTSLEADELGGFDIENYTVDFSDEEAIKNEMETFDTLQGDLNLKSVEIGTKGSMLFDIATTQENTYTNISEARGEIINTNVAEELVKYVQYEILQSVVSSVHQNSEGLNSNIVLRLTGVK